MDSHRKLLLANKAWAREKSETRPGFFQGLAKDQAPDFLWIGCSDSRVPAEEVTGAQPGELFVHRNIANLVVATDFNCSSVIQYAVEALKVKHIIVCGHYGCGGVRAALSQKDFGLMNKWIFHIKQSAVGHVDELMALPEEDRVNRLVEINVKAQVQNIARAALIQRAWKNHQRPTIHGWVFGLNDGLIRELIEYEPGSQVDGLFQFKDL